MKKQIKLTGVGAAMEVARLMSEAGNKYGCVVDSKGVFYAEDEPPLVRVWETLVAEYEEGKLITQS